MNVRLDSVLRWLLTLPIAMASSVIAAVAMEFSIFPDRMVLAWFSQSRVPPALILRLLHLVCATAVILLWSLPPAWAIGFALRRRASVSLRWGISIAMLAVVVLSWFFSSDLRPWSRWITVTSGAIVIGGIVAAFTSYRRYLPQLVGSIIAILLLFVPSLSALIQHTEYPSTARKVWSVVLQRQTWQAMNTGSEYAATRQVVFAGDRIVVVFDAGSASYEGNTPMSHYRVISLDRETGQTKNEQDFIGRWGSMPYLYATADERIDVQSNPPRRLNPDLTPANEPPTIDTLKSSPRPSENVKTEGKCSSSPVILTSERTLYTECRTLEIVDRNGKIVAQQQAVDGYGRVAAVSQDGSRFALESYAEEGDPSRMLYERFGIYNGITAAPIAMIPITDLPERESWSAFSVDGRYFVVGNPNRLSLYQLP